MHQHQFHELARFRANDLQRQAQRERLAAVCRQEQKRADLQRKSANRSRKAFRQQGRTA